MSAMIRPAALVGAFVVGWFFPQGAVLRSLIPWFVGFMLFMTFLGLDVHKMAVRRSHIAIVIFNILIGVGGYQIVCFFSSEKSLALATFFAGMAPTATAAPAIARFLKRESEYIVTGLLLTTACVTIALPFLIPWVLQEEYAGGKFFVGVLSVAKSVATTLVLPIILARTHRAIFPSSKTWTERFKNVTFVVWILMVVIIACRASAFIRDPANGVSPTILFYVGASSLIVCVANFTIGYFIGEKEYRAEASQTLGQKNTAVMICFATLYTGPLASLGPTIYVLWHNLWNAAQLALVARQDRKALHAEKTAANKHAE